MRTHFWKSLLGMDALSSNRRPDSRLQVEALEARDVPTATATATVDLSAADAPDGVINGAIFRQADSTDTSSVRSFVRIHGDHRNGVEQGYNTDAGRLQFDVRGHRRGTHALRLADVPVVTIDGVAYREFMLDINQKSNRPLLSLDELRIFAGDAANLHHYNTRTDQLNGLTALYDLDAGGDHWVLLNARHNRGSTAGDMVLYVPDHLFANSGEYVYLYSKFGKHAGANGRFEQWGVRTAVTPPNPALGSISGVLFNDLNRDGSRVDEDRSDPALAGWRVYLDMNNNDVLGDEGDVFTTTDENGFYQFNNLAIGRTYHVVVESFDGPVELDVTLDEPGVNVTLPEIGVVIEAS